MAANMDVRCTAGSRTAALLIAVAAILALAPAAASAATTTETFDVGPVNVGGYEVQQSVRGAPHPDFGSAESGFITKMEVDVVDADGNPIPIQRLMLHHIVFANLARPDTTCSSITGFDSYLNSGLAPERFFAAGEERAKMALPESSPSLPTGSTSSTATPIRSTTSPATSSPARATLAAPTS